MALTPVDYDPFAAKPRAPPPTARGPKLTPVDHDPFGADAPRKAYPQTSSFDSEVDGALGKGKWKATGDYRSPQREDQLRAQGAGTVAPGRMSNHSRGAPDAPGAHDLVANDPRAVDRLRRLPGVKDAFYEGHKGSQGGHIHVDTPDVLLTPVDHDPFAQTPSAPQKAPAATQPPKLTPVDHDPFAGAKGYLKEEFESQIMAPAKKVAEDFTHPYKAPPVHNPWDVVRGIAGEQADSFKNMGDAATLAMQAAGGGLIHAGVVRPLAEAGKYIPMPTQIGKKAPPTQAEREKIWEGIVGKSLLGLGPEARVAERPALSAEPRIPKPEVPHPEAQTGKVVGNEKDAPTRVDNALYRLGGHATAGKIEALQTLKRTPKEIRDPKVQEELTHAVEERLKDPNTPIPEHLQAAEAVRQPWAERQRTAINSIREKMAAKGATEEEIAAYAPDSGYVPRRVVGKSPGIDPDAERAGPLAWNQGKKSLAKTTSSMKARDQIVLQFEDGTRRFEHRNPTNDEWKPGMQVRDPLTGKPAEVKGATIKEIEGAGARDRNGEPIQYHKNALVNTIDEALRAERVDRNLDVLDELTKGLKEQGLAHQGEWHFKNADGQWVRAKANSQAPEGFREVPNLPQLKGWSFDPKVADVLKDYYPGPKEPLDNVLSTVNRALNASLFITPFPHIKNVGTMGFIGRGWDWIPTGTNYGRLMNTSRDAIGQVLTMGPKYRDFLREGAGMQAGDDATRNFYQTMLEAASKDITADPKVGKAMGFNPVEVGKALYDVSHKILWNVNDMVMLQRYLELQSKGMSKRQAIAETEKWVANYRIPSQVMKSRAAAELFKRGDILKFGRYTYGKWRAIGEMARGMLRKDATPAERMDALGKVVALGVMGLIVYPAMDKAAQMLTGNKKAKVGRGGELGPIDAALDPEKDVASKISSIATPAPAIQIGMEVSNNRDLFTGKHIVEPQSSPLGQAVQGGEYAAGQFYPAQLGMDAMKPGGAEQSLGRLAGVNLPPEGRDARMAKGKRYDRRQARTREKKDPVEQWIKENVR